MYNQGSFSYRPAVGCSWLPAAKAEDLSTSSSSCPCDRYWRPSRESSVLHALARLPDRFVSRRHSVCLGGNPCRGFRGCDRQGRCARLRAKEFTSLRAASSCSRRSSIRAAGARQGRPRERPTPTPDTGCPIEKEGSFLFHRAVWFPVLHPVWFVNAFQIGRRSFDQRWTCKRTSSVISAKCYT